MSILKVCIFGPESTGKSTLTEKLARHFNTCFVPEYAKTLIEQKAGEIGPEDIPLIARGQMESEDRLLPQANRVLFCDTDLITTTIWSDWLFGSCPAWIKEEANKRRYDLYLLTDIDTPWIADIHRYLPEKRDKFLKRCQNELDNRAINYVKINGPWEERFTLAAQAIDDLLRISGKSHDSGQKPRTS